MNSESSWDFRGNQELAASHSYNKEGYIIEKADFQYLELIKYDIEQAFFEFVGITGKKAQNLKTLIFQYLIIKQRFTFSTIKNHTPEYKLS